MKFAIITDQHFCVRDSSEYFIENYRKFYTNVFFPYLKEHGITTILCLGDTFEDRRKLNINGLQAAREMYFDVARDNGIKIITILGNHDVYYRNTNEINSIDILCEAYDNIDLVYDTRVQDFDGVKIALCSWINKENYRSKLDFIKNSGADILAGHFEINGFEMTRGNVCESGMTKDLFSQYDEVWSGHFHIKSQIDDILMLGNPSQTNKGDLGYKRGFHVFNTDDRVLTFIENPYEVYTSLNYTDDINVLDYDFTKYENLFVNVNITSYLKVDTVKLNLFVDTLNQHAHSVDIVEWENEISQSNIDMDNLDYTSNLDVITTYIDKAFDVKDDSNYLKSYMTDLYNEAVELVEDE